MAVSTVEKPVVEKWYRISELMTTTGLKRTFLYHEMDTGRLRSKKVGGARVIPESALAEWQAQFDGNGEVG